MTTSEPKIEFPCDYPIKVLGTLHDAFQEDVLRVIGMHSDRREGVDPVLKISRKGTYASLTVTLWATSEAQLRLLHRDLMMLTGVKMVL